MNLDKKCLKLGGEILNILISKGLLSLVDYPTEEFIKTYKKPLYVKCLYDLNLIPVKFNLPMVVPPIPWHIDKQENDKTGKKVNTVLRGGYLTDSADIYYRYRLISSKNPELFKLRMTVRSEKDYLSAISLLQSVGFRTDDTVIEFLTKNIQKLIEYRLLSDSDFIGINPDSFVLELKNSIDIKYGSLLKEFISESHKARNEQNVLSIAKAYSGYDLYFPAFQDFRGRIYRTGIFNLHECDLYRSLLKFKCDKPSKLLSLKDIPSSIKVATAKRYNSSFNSDESSIKWFDQWYENLKDNDIDSYVIESMKSAKDPFQFMRKALLTLKGGCFEAEPVFMDATSSAYQIMSYLLQDTEIAFQTNLIKGFTREDLYTNLREDYLKYLREGNHLNPRLEPFFTRKLIKKIFMPITYGKTVKAIADDLYEVLCNQISYKSCMILGKESFKFWCIRYKDLYNMLKLFGGVGYLCSSLGRAVKLSTPLFYSYQDYRKFEKQSVWIYSNKKSKDKRTRHKLSFNILTKQRNVLKSKCATFANFIHQKDALVAINTICSFYETYGEKPIYTVHDCFVSNYEMSEKMADIYKETLFKSLGNPMELINMFLFYNLIAPNYPNYMSSNYTDDSLDFMIHNPISHVSHCLSKSDPIPVEHLNIFVQKWIDVKVKSLGVAKTKIRLCYTDMGEFKFTVNYIIDTGSENSEPLNPNDLEDFQLNKRHPRLMQLTVGPSIYGNNWYSELKQRLFDMAERYQDTYIYGIGLYLYAAKNPENFNVSDMDPEVIKNSIYEIVKEQPRKENQETLFTILGSKEESIRERERAVDSEDKAQSTSTHQDENQKATGSYINPSKPDKNTKAYHSGRP
ncbi:hypothetical protein L7F22_063293 [Adiantum nelumboides]|nr:hypothetical protein [Adiantum nelumboides]